ncbi:MAG: DinB family protein [Ornithinibacter sp.]
MADNGMWSAPGTDPREGLPPGRGEREVLAQYLEHYRMTLELKCEGLDAAQLAARSVPPSTMSLLGLVRHLARVEHGWWRRTIEGRPDLPRLYRTDGDPDLDFTGATPDDATVADAWRSWRTEVEHAREVYAGLDLDALIDVHGEDVEGRDIVVHLVEEYARHCGHADLLRECVDGRTGQ